MAKRKTEEQKELQRLLVAAEKAITTVLKHAEKHDLCFQINGVRHGYLSDGRHTIPDDEISDHIEKDGSFPGYIEMVTSDLDLDSEWVGSWC